MGASQQCALFWGTQATGSKIRSAMEESMLRVSIVCISLLLIQGVMEDLLVIYNRAGVSCCEQGNGTVFQRVCR